MDIESRNWRIQSGPAGTGFTLTKKAGAHGPAWHCHLASAPDARRLAMMSESQFNREAAEAWESGAWD